MIQNSLPKHMFSTYNSQFFKFKIYEAYKPDNLFQLREYFEFMNKAKKTDEFVSVNTTPAHIVKYLS